MSSAIESTKVEINNLDRTPLIGDLILFTIYLLTEKTNQRFEMNNRELFNKTFLHLDQITKNVIDQLNTNREEINLDQMF